MNKNNLFKHLYFQNQNHNSIIREVDTNIEDKCNFISSRGILKSCDIKSIYPISSSKNLNGYDFSKISKNSIIYICSSAINEFKNKIGDIKEKFILVTGDSDISVPDNILEGFDFINFIENEKIIHWFAQNCIGTHPKLSLIPIGLDYHTLSRSNHEWGEKMDSIEQEKILISIKNMAKPWKERKIIGYSNFHFYLSGLYCNDRKDAIHNIQKDLVYYEPTKVKREEAWKNQSDYAFVISPHGNGLDCHRTWEALCLGCIVIVKTSKIDKLYEELPVLIVNDWKDINVELLNKTVNDFSEKKFNYEKLSLKYWIELIKNHNVIT
jgi:hypothetical protein